MILKEAYRYQNYLESLLNEAISFLSRSNNITITTETHMRAKVRPEMEDETKDNLQDREINAKADDMIDFINMIVEEKDKVGRSILKAKTERCLAMDHDIAMNKVRQKVANCLRHVANTKNKSFIKPATGYCFNSEGNQVSFFYDVKYETKTDFDRKKVKTSLYNITDRSDKISNQAELFLTSVEVDFNPKFNINDTFEEIVDQFSAYGIGAAS